MRAHRSQSGKRKLSLVNLALLVLYVLLASVATVLMFKYHVLAFNQLNYTVATIAAGVAGLSLLLILIKRLKALTTLVLVLGTIVSATGIFGMKTVMDLSEKVTAQASYSEYGMAVLVRADDEVNDVTQLQEVTAPNENDAANIEALIKKIETEKGVVLTVNTVASYVDAYQALVKGDVKAILMNSAFESIILSEDADYNDKVRKIYTSTIRQAIVLSNDQTSTASSDKKKTKSATDVDDEASEKETDASGEKADSDKDADDADETETAQDDEETLEAAKAAKEAQAMGDVFNIYVSGIDTYGAVSTVSRSDVNIIITVNRKTKQVLLTTTPRDSYVRIAGGGNNQYDKLTHAGIYGVGASIQTLENLYGITMDYYVRLNFTSFMSLIDLVGGVEVYNDQAFVSHIGKHNFPVGNVTLNSELALAFVRERYSLQNGDDDRGRNQEKVIAALINKMSSPSALKNYPALIEGLASSVQTNMDLATMMKMANAQLASGSQYQVTSQALEGAGSTGLLPSYAMPTYRLYMVQINPSSLASVRAAIYATMAGK